MSDHTHDEWVKMFDAERAKKLELQAEIGKANDNCVRLEDKFMRREEELLGKLTAAKAELRAKLANLVDAITSFDDTHQASRNYLRKAIVEAREAMRKYGAEK